MRKPLTALMFAMTVGMLVLVVDVVGPLFGYENWRYGEDEMRAAVEGTWELTIAEPDGTTKTWKLGIRQRGTAARAERDGWIRSAAACGDRTFVRSAHACITASSMPIEIAVLERPDTPPVSGEFYVNGTTFKRGHLTMHLGSDQQRLHVGASIDPTGKVLELSAEHPGANTRSQATLVRTRIASSENP